MANESTRLFGVSGRMAEGAVLLVLAAGSAVLVVQRMRSAEMMASGLAALPDFTATWTLMMAAMMLPSALPSILSRGHRGARAAGRARPRQTAEFVVAYLAAWTLFGVVAYAATSWAPQAWFQARVQAGVLLALAGLYELTPLKRRHLQRCRSGEHALGLRAGARYGGSCILSSAALMLVLLLLAPTSLPAMLVAAFVILVQKVVPKVAVVTIPVAVGLLALAVTVTAAA